MCNLSRKRFLHKVLLEKITKPETRIEIVFSFIHWFYFLHQELALVLIVNSSAKLTLHHNKSRTKIPRNFFMKLLYIFLGSLWTQLNSYKSISSVSTQFQLLMNLLRQKVSFLIKLFFKKASERSGRIWTDGHSVLYECTALTSWATGPLISISSLFNILT